MKVKFLIFFLTWCQFLISQNLVLNSSFEENKLCPTTIGSFNHFVANWTTPNYGSTDYFSRCSTTVGVDNFFGKQEARTGKAYCGMYVMAPENYREYIQGHLSQPLTIGKTYVITFYISLAENPSHAIRDLGVLFLKEPIKDHSDKVININKVLNEEENSYFVLINSQNFYTEKESWEKVTFEYVAKGFEEVFILGNFDKNHKIANIKVHNSKDPDASYYYLDDFSIELIDNRIQKSEALQSYSIDENQVLENDKVYTLKNVLFDFDKHNLLESSVNELDQLYNYLDRNKRLQIEIYGHTDDVGTKKRNDELSILRAKEVALYLILKGLRGERITAMGYGNNFPKASNDNEEGRALNRRVEFKLIFK